MIFLSAAKLGTLQVKLSNIANAKIIV